MAEEKKIEEARYMTDVCVVIPNQGETFLEIYQDPISNGLFGVESEFLEKIGREVRTPYHEYVVTCETPAPPENVEESGNPAVWIWGATAMVIAFCLTIWLAIYGAITLVIQYALPIVGVHVSSTTQWSVVVVMSMFMGFVTLVGFSVIKQFIVELIRLSKED
jgi:hypothetical protein